MHPDILKHKLIERYLNKIDFKGIRSGSLIAQYYALNIISKRHASPVFANLLVLIKYILTLWSNKKIEPHTSSYLFTKLSNRFHYNALMDPLILRFYNDCTVLCDENSFDQTKFKISEIREKAVLFSQTNSNRKEDSSKILNSIFRASFLLLKHRKQLKLSFSEVIFFLSNLLVQMRRASFWDHYFSIQTVHPKCVVTEFDRFSEAAPLILAARKHQIITITMIHGVLEDYSFTPILSDYVFCWGEGQKSQLISRHVDPRRIFVTGNPIFEDRSQEEINPEQDTADLSVCLAISPGFDNRLLIEPFAAALSAFDHCRGIVKLHPSLKKEEYRWVENFSPRIEVLSSQDITNGQLFKMIDLLIINESGIANEALAAGVPALVFVPEIEPQFNDFQKELIFQAQCRWANDEISLKRVFSDIVSGRSDFRKEASEKSKGYLKNLYDSRGQDSVRAMIQQIESLSKTR